MTRRHGHLLARKTNYNKAERTSKNNLSQNHEEKQKESNENEKYMGENKANAEPRSPRSISVSVIAASASTEINNADCC